MIHNADAAPVPTTLNISNTAALAAQCTIADGIPIESDFTNSELTPIATALTEIKTAAVEFECNSLHEVPE